VDVVFDNDGAMILAEFSSQHRTWAALDTGQRIMYENLIKSTDSIACVCHHNVPITEQIRSDRDVEEFQVMFAVGPQLFISTVFPGKKWRNLVTGWFDCPRDILFRLFEEENQWKS